MKSHRTLHRELWQWLAENPSQSKGNWPGWITYQHNLRANATQCWACAKAAQRSRIGLNHCSRCPCDWQNNVKYNPCLICGSSYDLWRRAKDCGNIAEASRLALIIRDSWK